MAPHIVVALRGYAAQMTITLHAAKALDMLKRPGVNFAFDGDRESDRNDAVVRLPIEDGEVVVATGVHAVAVRRRPVVPQGSFRLLSQSMGISYNEARLALALARGLSLSEAAADVGLTEESGRNYSKRIFAKTGARGQVDLVRQVLTSIAMLA